MTGAAAAEARLKVLAAAESCLGVPYRYAGIDRKGLDCSGLVYLSFREGIKYTVPRSTTDIYAWAEKIAASELQLGDLVFFVTTGPGVSHVGIYAGNGRFIHAASAGPRTGVIYSRLDEAYWKRTFVGAGRALPWDQAAATAMAAAIKAAKTGKAGSESLPVNGDSSVSAGDALADYPGIEGSGTPAALSPVWEEPGFYAGFGAAWTWGGFFEGAPSLFRGISSMAALGYKWQTFRLALELRPEWDRALGVFRLPLTVSFGTDNFRVFAGPAYTFGDPALTIDNMPRLYQGGGAWFGELGLSAASPPIKISRGALSFWGELAWQPYKREEGNAFDLKPDLTANLRLSTGLSYLWRLGE